MKRFAGKVAICLAVLLAVVTLAGYLAITVGTNTGTYATFVVLSDSMEPTIPIGALVVATPIQPEEVRIGDVITFSAANSPYKWLTHRVVSIDHGAAGLTFQTKGDANELIDPWTVSYSDRAGKVRLAVPLAGYVVADLSSGLGRTALGLVFAVLLAVGWLSTVWRKSGKTVAPLPAPARSDLRAPGAISLPRLAVLAAIALLALSPELAARRSKG